MLKTFLHLLGTDTPVFRRYLRLAVAYGVLSGLSIAALVPVLAALLAGDMPRALPWLAALLAGVAACWILRRHVEQAGVRVGVTILRGGRHRLGEHVARLPVGWFTPANTARLGHVITQGMMAVAQLPAHVFTPLIAGIVTPLVLTGFLFALHWPLGVIALAALPLLASVLALTARLSRHADAHYQRQFAQASQRVLEFAQAQSLLRAFNGEGSATQRVELAVEEQRRSGRRLIWLSSAAAVLNAGAVQAVLAVMLGAAGWWLDDVLALGIAGTEHAAAIVALVVAPVVATRLVDSLLEAAGYGEVPRGARGHLNAVRDLFAAEPMPEPATPQTPQETSIELRNVRFRYAEGGPEVLRGVSLRIAPGTMTAVIGASGSGKTTLARLIARFYDVDQGSVLVGGVDVRQLSGAQLAQSLSQIFQDTHLFAGTIAANIRVGNPAATAAQLQNAVRQAGVADIVARLPQGLDTAIGEGGARLSGGERQRIAIARALIKDAPILLVDEATAALDTENQATITATLARLHGRRTVLVIAHQLSTVARADQIVVLEDGQVAEHGTPAQLLARQGRYAQFLAQRRAAAGWRIGATGPSADQAGPAPHQPGDIDTVRRTDR